MVFVLHEGCYFSYLLLGTAHFTSPRSSFPNSKKSAMQTKYIKNKLRGSNNMGIFMLLRIWQKLGGYFRKIPCG
jgi:hypothetical protein